MSTLIKAWWYRGLGQELVVAFVSPLSPFVTDRVFTCTLGRERHVQQSLAPTTCRASLNYCCFDTWPYAMVPVD